MGVKPVKTVCPLTPPDNLPVLSGLQGVTLPTVAAPSFIQKSLWPEMMPTPGVKGKQKCLHVLRKRISCQFSDITPH